MDNLLLPSGGACVGADGAFQMPLASMVRALCKASATGSDVLYDVMLKVALMVDATAQTYGLATFAQKSGERPRLKWVEGLTQEEIAEAEAIVVSALADESLVEVKSGDREICLTLSVATAQREGAAIYGRYVRPLSEKQACELRIISYVARLAHTHAQLREDLHVPVRAPEQAVVTTAATLPGMVFVSRAMAELARAVERVQDSESTVLITGE